MKYIKRDDYEGIEIPPEAILCFACCDCGAVHDMAWAIEEN